jgi:hypothetical protein
MTKQIGIFSVNGERTIPLLDLNNSFTTPVQRWGFSIIYGCPQSFQLQLKLTDRNDKHTT